MISECILPNLPASATVTTDDFRNWKLYGPDVEDIFRRYISSLRAIFKFYSGQDYDGISHKGELLSLEEFTKVLMQTVYKHLGRSETGAVVVGGIQLASGAPPGEAEMVR